MKIAVIGTGDIGGTIGLRWAEQGYQIVFGSRDPQSSKVKELLDKIGENGQAVTLAGAAEAADVILFAVPWPGAQQTLGEMGDLNGKVLMDCTNPIAPGFRLAALPQPSAAEQIAYWAPEARVVKAFNTVMWENIADPYYDGEPTFLPICGDDEEAKRITAELAAAIGFDVHDIGPLENAHYLESLAMISIHLVVTQGYGRNFTLKLVTR